MSNLHVTYADLDAAKTRLDSGHQTVTDKVNELKSLVDTLVSSGFDTDLASVKFQETVADFSQQANSVLDVLLTLGEFLQGTKTAFETADSELAAQLGA